MPPSYVKGHVKRSESDAADAAAICEAVTCPSMRFVAIKSTDQQMALRPSQIRASAAESALMIPDAFHLRSQYADLEIIIAGEEDRLIDIETEPARLHSDISLSGFHRVLGNGHMIYQTATDQVMSAIREVASGHTLRGDDEGKDARSASGNCTVTGTIS